MKLVRKFKVEYDEKDQAIIPVNELFKYDVYFIDNQDYLCIDEDEYTQEKVEDRMKERLSKRYSVYKDDGNGLQQTGYVYAPYIPLEFIKLKFEITKNGVSFT